MLHLSNLTLDDWLVIYTGSQGEQFYLVTEMWPEWNLPNARQAVLERAARTELRFWYVA